MLRITIIAFALVLTPLSARAASLWGFDRVMMQNTPNQVVEIYASSDTPIDGLWLALSSGLTITKIDLINDTIFESNNYGQLDLAPDYMPPGHEVVASTGTASGFVANAGLVARVTIDATGVWYGTYPLSFEVPGFGPSELYTQAGMSIDANPILLIFMPEPSSVSLSFIGAGVGAVLIRQRRIRGRIKTST